MIICGFDLAMSLDTCQVVNAEIWDTAIMVMALRYYMNNEIWMLSRNAY